MRKTPILFAVLSAGTLLLSSCGSDDGGGSSSGAAAGSGSPSVAGDASPSPDGAALSTEDTDLGTVVVDGDGRTVYVFDHDTRGSGTSSCSGQCLQAWPPVVAESTDPVVDGVSGDVGTITRDDGTLQLTLDGWPLYRWQGDAGPGDTTGQGVQGVWWVVGPDGARITATAAPDTPDAPVY